MIALFDERLASKKKFLEKFNSFTKPVIRDRLYPDSAFFSSSSMRRYIYVAKGMISIESGGETLQASKGQVLEQKLDGTVVFRILQAPCKLVILWPFEVPDE